MQPPPPPPPGAPPPPVPGQADGGYQPAALTETDAYADEQHAAYRAYEHQLQQQFQQPQARPSLWKRVLAPLAGLGALLAKLKVFAVLLKLKFVGTAITMVVSVAAYAWFWGWKFAVGFVLLMFVHEMGHVVALRARGVPASAPKFIPFLGAFVSMHRNPRDAYEEAITGIAGPIAGTIAAMAVAFAYAGTGSGLLRALAFTGFFLNLFNLLPVLPLDGGRVAAAMHPAMWAVGLVGLLGLEILRPTPIVPLVLILGGLEMWRRWRGKDDEARQRYYSIGAGPRTVISVSYLGLIGVLVVAMHAMYVPRSF